MPKPLDHERVIMFDKLKSAIIAMVTDHLAEQRIKNNINININIR